MNIELPGATLMQGDCLRRMKEIPSASIDMVLTDPPYGMAFQSNHRGEKHKAIANDVDLGWLPEFVAESHRVAAVQKKRRFTGIELEHSYFGTCVQRIGAEACK